MVIVLDHKQIKTVDVEISGVHYGIPLLSQLSVKDVLELKEAAKGGEDAELKWSLDYLKRYIPEDVLNSIRMADIATIFDAIKLETEKDGTSMGES